MDIQEDIKISNITKNNVIFENKKNFSKTNYFFANYITNYKPDTDIDHNNIEFNSNLKNLDKEILEDNKVNFEENICLNYQSKYNINSYFNNKYNEIASNINQNHFSPSIKSNKNKQTDLNNFKPYFIKSSDYTINNNNNENYQGMKLLNSKYNNNNNHNYTIKSTFKNKINNIQISCNNNNNSQKDILNHDNCNSKLDNNQILITIRII
jgi:hypothetical protein